MNRKPTLVYINPDYFTQVDDTVLCHLTNDFQVVWIYLFESFNLKSLRYGEKYVTEYGRKYGIKTIVRAIDKHGRHPSNFFFYRKLVKEINSYNPDLVYHCLRNPYWGLAMKIALHCNTVIMGVHDAQAHSYTRSITSVLNKCFRDVILRFHNHFVTFSKNQHDLFLADFGLESAMVGMSYKEFGKSDRRRAPLDNGVNLLFFGGIQLYKGLDLLIKAMEELKEEKGIKNLHLTIAGNGAYWDMCKSYIKTPELYSLKVRFIDNDEIPDLMSEAHFLCLPYRNATQSGPLVTAMAYELPIIAPSYGCFSDTYSDKSAMLYSVGNIKEVLEKVAKMSQTEYERIQNNCHIVKKNHSEKAIANNYIEYFKSLLK